MIRIDRSSVARPESLDRAGSLERERAEKFFAVAANKEKRFPFKAYKAPDVVEALNKLFHGKCAYCESSIKAVMPTDIEHFRPKGAVLIDRGNGKFERRKPGYYWLAADWENLLPSCIDCNRARTQPFPDDVTEVSGKENKFPLLAESSRASRPGDEKTLELGQRLLLHPCQDRPERHLEYLPNGLIRKRRAARGRKGTETIEVLALRRGGLRDERREHLKKLARDMRGTLYFVERLEADPHDAAAAAELATRLSHLREATAETEPYAGMTRQFVAAFEASLKERTVRKFVQEFLAAASTRTIGSTPRSGSDHQRTPLYRADTLATKPLTQGGSRASGLR